MPNHFDVRTDKRHIAVDEHPCSFCAMTINVAQGCACPYAGMTDEQKFQKCRSYYYFLLLKKYEDENFN